MTHYDPFSVFCIANTLRKRTFNIPMCNRSVYLPLVHLWNADDPDTRRFSQMKEQQVSVPISVHQRH